MKICGTDTQSARAVSIADRQIPWEFMDSRGAGLHSRGSAEGDAEVTVCEGNLQGMQPKDRASSVSPRYRKVGMPTH